MSHTSRARAFLRRHQDDTIGTTGTIDSGRAGILQYGDRLYILSGNVTQIATGNTVNHHQWTVAGCQRTSTTHLDISHGIRIGIGRRGNVQTSHLTSNQSHGIAGSSLIKLILADLNHRARDLFLGHRAITYYYDFVQLGNILLQRNLHTILGRLLLRVEADVSKYQRCSRLTFQAEVSVEVCHCTVRCSFDHDRGTYNALARLVFHMTVDCGLC